MELAMNDSADLLALVVAGLICLVSCSSDSPPASTMDVGGEVYAGDIVEAADTNDTSFEDAESHQDAAEYIGPERETVDPVLAESFQALLDEQLAFSAEPGVSLSVRTAQGKWWTGSSGVADLLTDEPMTPQKGFRVGSNTKTFMAAAIVQLQEEGLVHLDDSIFEYLPQYPQWTQVSIRHILGMQSGIPDYLVREDVLFDALLDPDSFDSPEKILSYVEELPLVFEPGTDCDYSNTNFVLAGMIIEQVTGNPVEEELEERFIKPLGLKSTFLDVSGEETEKLAHGYMDLPIMASMLGLPPTVMAMVPEEIILEGHIMDTTHVFPPGMSWAAGALVASPLDMAIFMRALLTGDLVAPELVEEMKTPGKCAIAATWEGYGLGIQTNPTPYGTCYGHGGLNFGYQVGTHYLPDHDLVLSMMHNFLPEQSHGLLLDVFKLALNGTDQPYSVCLPPEGFFDEADGDRMEIRFKGPLNEADEPEPARGLGYFYSDIGGQPVPLYGFSCEAALAKDGLIPQIEIHSLGPGPSDEVQLREAYAIIPTGVFVQEEGVVEISKDKPYAVVAAAEISLHPITLEATKFCVTAVPDFTRTSKLYICKNDEFEAAPGETIRLFGSVALTTSLEDVESYLDPMGFSRCRCSTPGGEWEKCE